MSTVAAQALASAEVERALDEGGLVDVYQPCYDLRTGALVAVEALARLRDPATGQVLPPARFIPAAEESGLITRLDLMMMERAFRQVARWRATEAGRDLCVAVNLSPVDLDDPGIADRIRCLAAGAGLPIDAVIVELTETVLAQAGRGHDEALAAISALGCNVTLDDFGTGNASFAYLRRFHANGIKIDRSFVGMLGEGGANERLVESLVRFCVSLDVHVVAEGIEEQSQVTALRRLGCHFGQGFFLSRPMTVQQLDTALHEGEVGLDLSRPADPHDRPSAPAPPKRARSHTPLLAALVVLLMTTLTALTVVGQRRGESSLHEAALDRLVTVGGLAAGEIDRSVEAVVAAVGSQGRGRAARAAVTTGDPALLDAGLAALMSTPAEIFSGSFYDPAGTMLALEPAAPGVVGENFAFRDWYRGAKASRSPYVSEPFQLMTPEAPWAVAVAMAIRDRVSRAPSGYVVATFVLAGMQSDLASVLGHHGVSATLVDRRGTVLAAPGDAGLGEPAQDPRLLAEGSATGEREDDDVQWAVAPVPTLGGWLLTEQSRSDALGAYPAAGRITTVLVGLLAGGTVGLVLLWARSDRGRRRLESEVAAAHGWLSTVLASTPTPLVTCDDFGRIQMANGAMADLLGTTVAALEGAELCAWLPLEGQPRSSTGVVTTSVVGPDGEVRVVEVRSQLLGDPEGRPRWLHAVADVTPHREERDRLRALGHTDPLTGVGNRRALRGSLAAALADRRQQHVVVMMDLDRFKAVNDTFGHSVGDGLLVAVAASLRNALRPTDTVARVGGDEFVAVVRLSHREQCESVAGRLCAEVTATLATHPAARVAGVGVSAGTAVVGADGEVGDELLFVADQRMYASKRAGRA